MHEVALDFFTCLSLMPDPRMGGMTQHRHSIGDYEQIRPHSGSNLQNFYATQRHQVRPSEAEQMLQAKRRMAAQRERELRNYHQEQQYNRSEWEHLRNISSWLTDRRFARRFDTGEIRSCNQS